MATKVKKQTAEKVIPRNSIPGKIGHTFIVDDKELDLEGYEVTVTIKKPDGTIKDKRPATVVEDSPYRAEYTISEDDFSKASDGADHTLIQFVAELTEEDKVVERYISDQREIKIADSPASQAYD